MNSVHETVFRVTQALDDLGVPYALMGGIATQILAIPTPTFDVDLTVRIAENRIAGLLESLGGIGFTVPDRYETGFVDSVRGMPKVKVIEFAAGDTPVEVDMFIESTPFQRASFERRRKGDLMGRSVWVFSPEDLVVYKLLAWRAKDRAAIVNVLLTCTDLDMDYLRRWAATLEVSVQLGEALREAEQFWNTQ